MRRALIGLVLVLVWSAFPVSADVVAKQGAPRFDPAKIFQSPMILEFDAPRLKFIAPQTTWRIAEVEQYKCEDVWITFLNVKRVDKGKGTRRFEISGQVSVAESFDRFVTLRFDLLDGETSLGAITKNKIDAEERKLTPFVVRLELDAPRADALSVATAPKLRMTLTLAKNGSNNWIPADQTQ